MKNEVNRAQGAKKSMRYLLTVLATVSVLGVYAQGLAQQEQTVFQSTSTMSGSGSSYSSNPSLNSDGTASYTPAQAPGRPGHIRRDGDPFGGETIGDVTNPNEPGTPIGDVFWPLMLLACVYALMRVILINKRKIQKIFLNE